MKCPRCQRAIKSTDTTHRMCGWNKVGEQETAKHANYLREERDEAARAEAKKFMAEHGLKDGADCRRFVMDKMRTLARRRPDVLEIWAKQSAVNFLVGSAVGGDKNSGRLLLRLAEEGIIDEHYQLLPIEQRAARAEQVREERRRVATDLEARRKELADQARVPGSDDEMVPA